MPWFPRAEFAEKGAKVAALRAKGESFGQIAAQLGISSQGAQHILRQYGDKTVLLHGPYVAPPLKIGDIVACTYRDCDVVIIGYSDGPISWPICRRQKKRAGVGLWLGDELERAVKTESEAAVAHWWGVNHETVYRWRKALGVAGREPAGTKRLDKVHAGIRGNRHRDKPHPDAAHAERMRSARANDGRVPRRPDRPQWTAEEDALLGTMTDREIARRTGRTILAVQSHRLWLAMEVVPEDRPWSETEDALLGTDTDITVAAKIGRTRNAVSKRRMRLGVTAFNPANPRPTNVVEDRVRRAGELARLGIGVAEIGRRLGISTQYAYQHVRRYQAGQ